MTLTLVPSAPRATSAPDARPAPRPLTGARFAIAAPIELLTAADAIDRGAPLPELRVQAGALAHRYIDAVVDGFILALARAVRGVPGAGARTAGLVRGFADRFVTPGVRHARKDQIDDFLGFLDQHVGPRHNGAADAAARSGSVTRGGGAIAFAIDEDFAAALAPALVADPAHGRDVHHRALHAMIDACMHHYLDAPLALLHLGLLARAAIAVGRSGVTTRAHGLVDDVLARPDPAPLARLAAFLAGAVVPA